MPLRSLLRVSGSIALLLWTFATTAQAASVSLVPTSATSGLMTGALVSFNVVVDFTTDENGIGTDRTLGGGFDLIFDDTHLGFVSLQHANLGDPDLGRAPDLVGGMLESWAFADFGGLTGPALAGSVVFEVIDPNPATSDVELRSTNGVGGPFVSDVDFVTTLAVDFDSIEIESVPEPSTTMSLAAGVAGLLLRARRRRRASGVARPRKRTAMLVAMLLTGLAPTVALALDTDSDGHEDWADNCSQVANADQRDTDQDGFGNVCDADFDNDGQVGSADLDRMRKAFLTTPSEPLWNPDADIDGDDRVNAVDLGLFKALYGGTPGPSGMSCAGIVPCPLEPFALEWPMPGVDAEDWVINNYVDLDDTGGVLDYEGGAKSYDGHRGVDIDVPSFREMDADFPILAAAEGVVLAVDDAHFDRNTSCAGPWNFVTLGHPNGFKTIYGHLKQGSVVVNVGDVVEAGDTLGVVGSSGCSTAPHLHLETIDPDGDFVSPFGEGLWAAPPVYDTPIGFMDAVLYNEPINDVDMIKDPPPNVTLVPPGTTLGVGLSMAGGEVGDSVHMRLRNSGGGVVALYTIPWPDDLRHSYWWWNLVLPTNAVGAHDLEIRVNGTLVRTYTIFVEDYIPGTQYVRHGVPISQYQALFNQLVANGFRAVWLDGYKVGSQTYMNLIFDKSPVASWAAAHGRDFAEHQAFFDAQTQAGRRLVHIDSYRYGNEIHYASIFVEDPGPSWLAYHGASQAYHQAQFDTLTAQGYRASVISVVEDAGGTARFTAIYDNANVGGWVALAHLTSAQYQAQFTSQANAGRTLAYLNAYTLNGTHRFTAIWDSVVPASWVGVHDRTSSQFQSDFDYWTGQGLTTRLVTGYDDGGVANFGGLWTD